VSLSLDVLKYCIIMLIGAYLGARFSPKPEVPPPIAATAKSESSSKASATCVVKKVTDSKGNTTETIESSTNLDNTSKNEASIVPTNQSTNGIDIFLGAGLNLDLKHYYAIEVNYKKHSVEIITDGVKDHAAFYKYKVLEWR